MSCRQDKSIPRVCGGEQNEVELLETLRPFREQASDKAIFDKALVEFAKEYASNLSNG